MLLKCWFIISMVKCSIPHLAKIPSHTHTQSHPTYSTVSDMLFSKAIHSGVTIETIDTYNIYPLKKEKDWAWSILVQLAKSSLAIHGGAYFSAVCG